jgi:hypothetical protein
LGYSQDGIVLQKTQQGNALKQLVADGQVYASYGQVQDTQSTSQSTSATPGYIAQASRNC